MANDNLQEEMQFQLELRPEIASGVYSNLALISHSHSDFVVDFARILPGMPKPEVCSRVQDNLYKYEKEFGKIELPDQDSRTIAPFGTGNGEAN